jgi:hypothetical protein
MTPEGRVKASVKKFLADTPKTWYFMPVLRGMGVMGIPDFVGVTNGKFFAIETKAGSAKPNLRQQLILDAIEAAGGLVLVVNENNLEGLEMLWKL